MTTSIIRITILLAAALTAFIGILSEPLETTTTWELDFLLAKTIGFAAAYIAYRLYRRWRHDPLIEKIEQISNNDTDTQIQ